MNSLCLFVVHLLLFHCPSCLFLFCFLLPTPCNRHTVKVQRVLHRVPFLGLHTAFRGETEHEGGFHLTICFFRFTPFPPLSSGVVVCLQSTQSTHLPTSWIIRDESWREMNHTSGCGNFCTFPSSLRHVTHRPQKGEEYVPWFPLCFIIHLRVFFCLTFSSQFFSR